MMSLRNFAVAALVLLPSTLLTAARAQPAQGPAFEVVSIRPVKPSSDPLAFALPGGVRLVGDQLRAMNISALALIHAAYQSEYALRDQIIGDGWIASERFDVEARAGSVLAETPTFTPLPPAAERMLRQVLQQRFQLRVRSETRELPRLFLTYARADRVLRPGIRVSSQNCTETVKLDGDCAYRPDAGRFSMRGRPIQTFVEYMSRPAYAGGAVIDETGITGLVDIDFQWTLDWSDMLASRSNLATALQEQLGLKLEGRRPRLPVLIIEHIERPSVN